MSRPRTLRLVLGDQLDPRHVWYARRDPSVTYLMAEVRSEATYARHHVLKLAGFFLAMRRFAAAAEAAGHRVVYRHIGEGVASLSDAAREEWGRGYGRFEYQEPDEYRVDRELSALAREFAGGGEAPPAAGSGHFLTPRSGVADHFSGRKQWIMESFYRDVRKRTGLLMEEDGPVGGRWNYDADNRGRYDGKVPFVAPPRFGHDVTALAAEIERLGIPTVGRAPGGTFEFPLDRDEALSALDHFVTARLPHFGRYQDALVGGEDLLFHSRLSFALNTKMIDPLETASAAVSAWEESGRTIPLSSVEGFVRQIIGWREYVRGVYWARMPGFASENYFGHSAPLPGFYWDGHTRMACVADALRATLDNAYAHHIQRLMVTGNLALLLGTHPDEVDAWYLGVYADAVEWVELPNTRGMSQFADGGRLATKPYVSGANYIDKTSDHCRRCPYDPKDRTGQSSCPFNSLYWDFLRRHRDKLGDNPRLAMPYRSLDRMDPAEAARVTARASHVRTNADAL